MKSSSANLPQSPAPLGAPVWAAHAHLWWLGCNWCRFAGVCAVPLAWVCWSVEPALGAALCKVGYNSYKHSGVWGCPVGWGPTGAVPVLDWAACWVWWGRGGATWEGRWCGRAGNSSGGAPARVGRLGRASPRGSTRAGQQRVRNGSHKHLAGHTEREWGKKNGTCHPWRQFRRFPPLLHMP